MITTKFTIPFATIMIAICGAFATNNNSVTTTNFVPVTLSEHSSVRDGVCDTDVTTKNVG